MFHLFDRSADFDRISGHRLPHWYQPGATYFVTFRTHDSLPRRVLEIMHRDRQRWLEQHGITEPMPRVAERLAQLPPAAQADYHRTFSRAYQDRLDQGYGACPLRDPRVARIVAESLFHFDGERYQLGDFVVMPNHVHVLVRLLGETRIVQQCTSWKRFTARKINEVLERRGAFWQEESFDHLVRSHRQLHALRAYIRSNPVRLPSGEYYLWSPAEEGEE